MFYCYLGMVRPIDLVMTVIEKNSLLYSQIPRRRDMPGDTQGSMRVQVLSRGRGKRATVGKSLYYGFLRKEAR